MNTGELMKMLEVRYSLPDWGLLAEVRDGTGFATAGRSMDALAFGFWPSRGLEIIGFELKVSRSDWQRELATPQKCEAFFKYVDRWYMVFGDEKILKPGELPATWGALVARGDKLVCKVEAPKLNPEPIDRLFMMSITRNFMKNWVSKSVFEERVKSETEAKIENAVQRAESEVKYRLSEYDRMKEKLQKFKQLSGVDIDAAWDIAPIGEAVGFIIKHGPDKVLKQFEYVANDLARIAKDIGDMRNRAVIALGELKEHEPNVEN
jgi:hypothetical protein